MIMSMGSQHGFSSPASSVGSSSYDPIKRQNRILTRALTRAKGRSGR
jgi:hypothetical protein